MRKLIGKLYMGTGLYRVNPCDFEHIKAMTPVQKFFEFFTRGTDCKCCLGARVVIAFLLGVAVGLVF